MKSKILFFLVFIILHFALAGCGQNLSAAPKSTSIPTKSSFLTKTSAPTTATRAPTIKVASTFTATLVETLTPTLTVAKVSTYSKNEFLELYRTNGNCQLPCWWGVVPGATTVDEMKLQFAPYGELIAFEEYHDKIILFYFAPSDSIDYNISSIIYFDETGTVTSISLDAETAMYNGFTPTYLLTNIGKPDQVQISSSRITMLYEKQNIFAAYDVSVNADTNRICFLNYNTLELWSTQVDSASPRAKNQKDDENLQSFYDAFKTWKGRDTCFSFQ